ncbi:MAG: AI-2E family transporter [Bacteroidetes bacterium]|nr:AI-2E family transporter [Bacteroidota bacterium]
MSEKSLIPQLPDGKGPDLLAMVAMVAACVILIAIAFLIPVETGPFVLSGLIAIILWPHKHHQAARSILYALVFILLIYIISELRIVLVPFIISFMVAYLMAPIMSWLRHFRIPAGLAAMLVTLIFLGGLTLVGFGIGPILIDQVKSLSTHAKSISEFIPSLLADPEVRSVLMNLGLDPTVILTKYNTQLIPSLQNYLFDSDGLVTNFPTLLNVVANVVLMLVFLPFLLFYFMRDYEELIHRFQGFIPDERREWVEFHSRKLQQIIATYVRGQLLIAFIGGVICLVPFLIFSTPYALVLSIGFLFLSLVPYVGVILMLVIGVLLCTSSPNFLFHATVVVATFLGSSAIQNFILTPKILGDRVGLHPVILLLSISIFGYFLGMLGLLIAIPLTAALNTYFKDWLEIKNQEFARQSASGTRGRKGSVS